GLATARETTGPAGDVPLAVGVPVDRTAGAALPDPAVGGVRRTTRSASALPFSGAPRPNGRCPAALRRTAGAAGCAATGRPAYIGMSTTVPASSACPLPADAGSTS